MLHVEIIPVTHYQQNCSFIWCDETLEAALVDPGGEPEKLIARVQRSEFTLTKVLLTHGHMDHVGAVTPIARAFDTPVVGPHRAESFWLDMLDKQASMMGFAPCEPVVPSVWLNDGDVVTLGNRHLQVFHCPGHTPGHVVFVDLDAAIAFVGDVLFKGSVGRTDFPRGNQQQLIDSIHSKLWPLGDHIQFVPGHGPTSTFGAERASNPFVADKHFG
ncbi:MBL fold metallo-hydrolase [Gilvimarinus sp. SDUM040013]|uniref:MBL fold metallo-hydrolase n=1 Tax=Gilvimarinus gilvus TaxID=3058038 RepID=A0ABU4RYA1_9GAMM|nr:MBL fold metallo-hydrolase [Gilvimarinus sp. SDUM040013]MDO3387376.1 MBL fold metallo-hydrolase [Gilvimarinus sp. SDUM040013]MDX6849853.1 MBL fold metallo-hydrolase [Gilvimarinus sp. SDUM040013]